ncbi:M56 family metallopeptidase [Ekhidna sp. To15]|uniref:M56 family metallopeptidase n=1 Tax=Ekhidna sp. To15 TaxID=3395267 RepID=UPI003F521952
MNQFTAFLIETLLLSSVFCLGYLVIQNHTTPTFKRFYLLAWMIFSVSFPLITVKSEAAPYLSVGKVITESSQRPSPNFELRELNNVELPYDLAEKAPISAASKTETNAEISWVMILTVGYCMVSGFLFLRIIIGLIQILNLKHRSQILKESDGLVYQVDDSLFNGASFFNWIFVGNTLGERNLIIRHERLHSKLGHSFDILLSHAYCAVFWLNPFSWYMKKCVALNTELEVDAQMLHSEDANDYANTLFVLSQKFKGPSVMNYFGAFYLKSRITALTKTIRHKHWVSFFSFFTVLSMFFLISCEGVNSSEVMAERLSDVKTITTRFTSHQADTQQKTGRIVAIASFSPDGVLEELVEQTTYPYDREFEVKKVFWEVPEKSGLPYVMDGLSLGNAEKSFLYGHDWPSAYYKHLYAKTQSRDLPWNEIVEVDNALLPQEITTKREFEPNGFVGFGMPDVTEYYLYEDEKVVSVSSKSVYKDLDYDDERNKSLKELVENNTTKAQREVKERMIRSSGKISHIASYEYDGDLLTSIKEGDAERRFYYENDLMIKSEYIRGEEVINTRIHYYKNSLKDRTEIFNRYNEPEYTITYEYEFW